MLLYNLKKRASSIFNSKEKDFFNHFPTTGEVEEIASADVDVALDDCNNYDLYNLTQFFMSLDKSLCLGIPTDRLYFLGDDTCEAYKKFKYAVTSLLLFNKLRYGEANHNIETIYPMNKRALLIK